MTAGHYFNHHRLGEIVTLVYRGSQRDAARHFHVTEPTLSRILSGISTPQLGQVAKIARSLGVPVDSLLVNGEG